MQQSHSFKALSTPHERRRKYNPLKDLGQASAVYPIISLIANCYAVEIGASATYEIMARERWQESASSDGSTGTRTGGDYEAV